MRSACAWSTITPMKDALRRQRHGVVVAALQALDELGCCVTRVFVISQCDRGDIAALIDIQPHHTDALRGVEIERRVTGAGVRVRYQARFLKCLVRWQRRLRSQ